MPSNSGTLAKSRTRSRSGCLNCRRRRRKCDGVQPRCKDCRTRGEECRWGLKVSFHPSRALELSSEDSAALSLIEEERALSGGQQSTVIIDDSEGIVREYHSHQHDGTSLSVLPSPEALPTDPTGHTFITTSYNLHRAEINSNLSHILEGIEGDFETGSSSSLNLSCAPIESDSSSLANYSLPFSLGQAAPSNASQQFDFQLPGSKEEHSRLLAAFLRETGTWCETTDSERHFTVSSIHDMMECPAFGAAAMALASKQLDAVRGSPRPITLGLYQHAIQLLIYKDPTRADETVLATCTLLCVYEMMASSVSEWRRHLKGCAVLLKTKQWNGDCRGIINACFWAFARIDVWAAYMIGERTLIPTDSWVNDSQISYVASSGNIDAYCNLANLIFAKIINLEADRSGKPQWTVEDSSAVKSLWNELQEWYRHRPPQVEPLVQNETSKSAFRTILYSHSSSICGNTFYHAGSILLLRTGIIRRDGNDTQDDKDKYDPVWHARELGAISISNVSHANWVNHLQPLFIAGQAFGEGHNNGERHSSHMTDDDGQGGNEYPAEKMALLKHLAMIERVTGWKTSARAAEMRVYWGIE